MIDSENFHFLFRLPVAILPNERLKEHSNVTGFSKQFELYALGWHGDDDGCSAVNVMATACRFYTEVRTGIISAREKGSRHEKVFCRIDPWCIVSSPPSRHSG
jgi:hypothetical protein